MSERHPLTFNEFATILEGAALQNLDTRLLRELLNYCNGIHRKVESLENLETFLNEDLRRSSWSRVTARELWNRFELARRAVEARR